MRVSITMHDLHMQPGHLGCQDVLQLHCLTFAVAGLSVVPLHHSGQHLQPIQQQQVITPLSLQLLPLPNQLERVGRDHGQDVPPTLVLHLHHQLPGAMGGGVHVHHIARQYLHQLVSIGTTGYTVQTDLYDHIHQRELSPSQASFKSNLKQNHSLIPPRMSVVTASPMRLPLHWLVGSKNYMMVSKTYMTTFSLWVIMLSSLAHVPIELSCPVWNSTHIWPHSPIYNVSSWDHLPRKAGKQVKIQEFGRLRLHEQILIRQ